jgi:hypothetical protein
MKRWLPFGLTLVLLCGVSGCKSSHDAIAADYIAIMNELADILDGVSDEASAQAAVPKIEKPSERTKELADRLTALGKTADRSEAERLAAKYYEPRKKMAQRLNDNYPKMQKYPALLQAYNKVTAAGRNLPLIPRPEGPERDPPRRY